MPMLTSEKIAVNRFLSITEEEILFSDISHAETSFSSNKDKSEFYYSYVITTWNGAQMDLFEYCNNCALMNIHSSLQALGVPFQKGSIDQYTYQLMELVTESERMKIIQQLYTCNDETG